jgi:hypothetical protein
MSPGWADLWFRDIVNADRTPYDVDEGAFVRELTGVAGG